MHSIHQIVEKTFDATLLPVVSVVSEASDNIFPHLIQQVRITFRIFS